MKVSDHKPVQMDALFRDFNHPNVPGAAVMVVQNGKIAFSKTYGLADLGSKTRCTSSTNFRLASVAKQFTAMAVLMLAEQKQLSLEDGLPKFFPELPSWGRGISVRHLLSHMSGVLDYEELIPAGTTIPLSDGNVLYLLRQQTRTYFAPGMQFRYSNSGYALLALIVEAVSGSTFAAFLAHNIFEPLKMAGTVAYQAGLSVVANRALGYTQKGNRFDLTDQSITSAVLGDGGIYSSVNDLVKWDQALYGEKLVRRAVLQQAFAAVSPTSDMADSGYGFGWYVGRQTGTEHVWHYGSTCGFSTRFDRFPQRKLAIIILANRRDSDLAHIAGKVIDVYL